MERQEIRILQITRQCGSNFLVELGFLVALIPIRLYAVLEEAMLPQRFGEGAK